MIVPDWEVAIGNDTAIGDFGRLTLRNVQTRGQVLLLATEASAAAMSGWTASRWPRRTCAAALIVRGPSHR